MLAVVGAACVTPQPQSADRSGERSGPSPSSGRMQACTITRIADGDSVDCEDLGRIRLIGIDAPELNQPPFGKQSAAALRKLMPIGSSVLIEMGIERTDRFGRLLGHIWMDSALVNWRMVSDGWAVLLTYPPNVRYVEWLTSALRAAQSDGVGLWATGGFSCLPVRRRRGEC